MLMHPGSEIRALALAAAVFGLATGLRAAHAADSAQDHLAAAAAAADGDLKGILAICYPRPPGVRGAAPAEGAAEPTQVFDNLFFLGLPTVSAWALKTSDGIIVLDSLDNADEARSHIEGGLKTLGLDPDEIKYVVITHAHGDHYGGATYLAEKFHARVVMSDIDWDVLAGPKRANYPANWGPIPKRDIGVKDGDTLTLGDTTIEFYLTPPHTPGTLSIIMPLADHGQHHVGAEWGGTAFNFAPTVANYETYAASAAKLARIADREKADVILSNHASYDNALEKIAALKDRKPGAPNPFVVGQSGVQRFLTVAGECAKAAADKAKTATPTP
jgi:metallo-beta-lactamase class B